VLADIVSVTVRALSFIALFQAAGMAMFIALFGREIPETQGRLRTVGTSAALLAMFFVLIHYALEAARMSGELAGVLDSSLQSMVMHSLASVALVCRVLGLLLLVAGFRFGKTRGMIAGLAGAALLLAGFTAVGHTAAHSTRWLLSAVLFVHLIGVAFWFGALAPLHRVSSRESPATAARIVERFSSLALWLVPGLFLAGLLLAVMLLPNLAALQTPYGRLLILKILGFTALMALASLNKWRLGPALARGDERTRRAFGRSLVAEYVLIAAVLCVTAVLTTFYSPES
jgi:putative copper resistance protein D